MPEYRLYFMDLNDHIQKAIEFECRNDQRAIVVAKDYADGRTMELWRRDRLVRRLAASKSKPAGATDEASA